MSTPQKSKFILTNDKNGQKKILDALINLSVLRYGLDVTQRADKEKQGRASGQQQKRTIKQTPLEKTSTPIKKDLIVGTLKRLFNDVQLRTEGGIVSVLNVVQNPFCEIDDITYPKEGPNIALPTTEVALSSQESKVDLKFYIKCKPKSFKKTFKDGEERQQTIHQHAIIDFGASPMTVEFRLFTLAEGKDGNYKDKFVFNSRYRFTSEGIELFPYTEEPTKKIVPIVKKIYQETSLPKSVKRDTQQIQIIGTKVNAFQWINSKMQSQTQISLNSNLNEIKTALDSLPPPENETQSNHSAIKGWILSNVLDSQENLDKHKLAVTRWLKNYQEYYGNEQYTPETISYECEYEEHIPPHISEYNSRLVERTKPYDRRIKAKPSIDSIEKKLSDYDELRAKAKEEEISKYSSLLAREPEISRQTALLKTHQSNLKRIDDKFNLLKREVEKLGKLQVLDGDFGIYPPYLVSDILRYRSTFVKQRTIDELCISSQNIIDFCGFVHGFKSQSFTFISLYMQLILGYILQWESLKKNMHTPTKINFEFFMPFYQGLDFMNQETKEKLAITTGQTQTQSLLTSSPSIFGVPVSQTSQELVAPKLTSTTVSNLSSKSQKLIFSDKPELTIKNKLLFDATQTNQENLIKIPKDFDTEPPPFILLKVTEPMFGQSLAVKDFDVLHCKYYLKDFSEISTDFDNLPANFNEFLKSIGEYEPDQIQLEAVEDLSDSFPVLERATTSGTSGTGSFTKTLRLGYLPKPKFELWPLQYFTIKNDQKEIQVEINLPVSNSSGAIVLERGIDDYNDTQVKINGTTITIQPKFNKSSVESQPINIKAKQLAVAEFLQGEITTQIIIVKEDTGRSRDFDPDTQSKENTERSYGSSEIKSKVQRGDYAAYLQRVKARTEAEAAAADALREARRWETSKVKGELLEQEMKKSKEEATERAFQETLKARQREFEKEEICKHLNKLLKEKDTMKKVCSFVENNLKLLKKSQLNSVIQYINENDKFDVQQLSKPLEEEKEPWQKSSAVNISEFLRLKDLWLEKLKAEAEKTTEAAEKQEREREREKERAAQHAMKKEKSGSSGSSGSRGSRGGSYEKYIKYKTKYLELKAKLNL